MAENNNATRSPLVTKGCPHLLSKLPLHLRRSPPPSNTPISRLTPLTTPNGIQIQLAIFPQFTHGQTDRPTDRWSIGDSSVPTPAYALLYYSDAANNMSKHWREINRSDNKKLICRTKSATHDPCFYWPGWASAAFTRSRLQSSPHLSDCLLLQCTINNINSHDPFLIFGHIHWKSGKISEKTRFLCRHWSVSVAL